MIMTYRKYVVVCKKIDGNLLAAFTAIISQVNATSYVYACLKA